MLRVPMCRRDGRRDCNGGSASVLLRRMSPLLALFVGSLQCRNSGAIGGTTDMPRIRRAYQSDVNDPEPGSAKTRSQRLFAIGSVRLGVGRPNHLVPFLGISDKELPELGRSADERCAT
jgi:hypothetical protein